MSTETDQNGKEPNAECENRPTRPLSLYLLGEEDAAVSSDEKPDPVSNIELDRNFLLDSSHPPVARPHFLPKIDETAGGEGDAEGSSRLTLFENSPPIPRILRPFTDSEGTPPGSYDRGRIDYPLYDGEETPSARELEQPYLPNMSIMTICCEPEENETFGLFHFYLELARRR